MKRSLWSVQTGMSVFALVVVGVVLLEHVRGVEPASRSERPAAAQNGQPVVTPAAPSQVAEDKTGDNTTADQPAAEKPASDEKEVRAGQSADQAGSNSEVEAAIRRSAADFVSSFDRGDAAAVAALWTADGELIDQSGKRFSGRTEIEREYAKFFADHPGLKIEIKIDSIRVLGPDTAIEDGHAALLPRQNDAPAASPYTVVHSRVDGQWLMASVREPLAKGFPTPTPLDSLDWLVGSWHGEKDGVSMDVTYRWIANHTFLERTFTVEKKGHVTATGVELIRQDPGHQEIQSWDFAADAGYAVGNWIAQPDGWVIITRGKLPGGEATSSVNYLARIDDNTLAWQSRERTVDGDPLPDTDAVQLIRDSDGE